MPGIRISLEIKSRIHSGSGRKFLRVDIIATPPKIIIRIPVYIRSQHCNIGTRLCRCDNPRKRKKHTRLCFGVQIIQSRSFGCCYILLVCRAGITLCIPLNTGLRIILIRRNLHRRPGAVFIVPTNWTHKLFLPPVPPQRQLVRLHRVYPEL